MRSLIVSELLKEVIGPRFGPEEVLRSSPFVEYLTGILAPRDAAIDREAEAEDLLGDSSELEEDQAEVSVAAYPHFSPTLNPQKQPSSIGLSFVLATRDNSNPKISVCATWGRYSKTERAEKEGKKSRREWKRKASYIIADHLALTPQKSIVMTTKDATLTNSPEQKVTNRIYTRQLHSQTYLVSIFLCNDESIGNVSEGGEARLAECSLFQPQIRIKCEGATVLKPLESHIKPLYEGDEEDRILHLLYKKKPVMAQGHMCAAVWHEVDPENAVGFDANHENANPRPRSPPFYWVDGDQLPIESSSRFRNADLRTELVPIYNITLPDLSWDVEFKPEPQLSSRHLAECWNPTDMTKALAPLADGYRRWIDKLAANVDELPEDEKELGLSNLKKHKTALKRITDALDLIISNEDVRLALCFMNKAMDLQRQWFNQSTKTSSGELVWRPFQLAFILLNISSIVAPSMEDTKSCDLLWVPTGTGKTEAYLGLMAFIMAYRRRSLRGKSGKGFGAGTSVMTRYTLRLLTLQQFRRTMRMVTACEFLRIFGLGKSVAGWRPRALEEGGDFLYGTSRFSIGLWVGGETTPNSLQSTSFYSALERNTQKMLGALDILCTPSRIEGLGEPAQVLNCPCCGAILSVPDEGLEKGSYVFHFLLSGKKPIEPVQKEIFDGRGTFLIRSVATTPHLSSKEISYGTISLDIDVLFPVESRDLDDWWNHIVMPTLDKKLGYSPHLESARASRPGYFIRKLSLKNKEYPYDFDIFCPNPSCELNSHKWCEGVPRGYEDTEMPKAPDFGQWLQVPQAFQEDGRECVSSRIPIPAYTVDDQIYHRCPSIVVATVDKFARLPFEPKTSAIFGNVDKYDIHYGYYRRFVPPRDCLSVGSYPDSLLEDPRPSDASTLAEVPPFEPPSLIIQDELHLIEGPLGSLVGVYESAIDALSSRGGNHTKYVASTATIRKASEQVSSVFARDLFVFPPPAIDADDSFFLRSTKAHPLDESVRGRLYVGICSPGKGGQTPVLRVWALLLQYIYHALRDKGMKPEELDPYWTIVGYFNAIRELAGATALYKQDIMERYQDLTDRYGRARPQLEHKELSSRISSTALPAYLDALEKKSLLTNKPDEVTSAIFTTNIFGVGVDIPRLGLMIVHGQPKTTSTYIQSTGRIGRQNPGIVVTFYRVTRPRDLSHYEFFNGYHSMLNRFVEPITVFPFAPRVQERATGPVMVAMLRCGKEIGGTSVPPTWGVEQKLKNYRYQSGARNMSTSRFSPEVGKICDVMIKRGNSQPANRRPEPSKFKNELERGLDKWHDFGVVAEKSSGTIVYWEKVRPGSSGRHLAVLGDLMTAATRSDSDIVYKNAQQSLRDIEETISIEVP